MGEQHGLTAEPKNETSGAHQQEREQDHRPFGERRHRSSTHPARSRANRTARPNPLFRAQRAYPRFSRVERDWRAILQRFR